MISQFLTESKVGNISTDATEQSRKLIRERWDNLGFTKGFTGYVKDNLAILFENTANAVLKEATDASNSGSFETVVFPLVRRVFSRLLANDIVSVQAMSMPIGKLFFILPVTSERQWNEDMTVGEHNANMGYTRQLKGSVEDKNASGMTENRYYLPDEAYAIDASGTTLQPAITEYFKKSLYDLFYDDFLYDNSKGKVTIKSGDVAAAEILANGSTSGATTLPKSGLDDTVRSVILEVTGFSSFNAGRLTGPDGNEMDTEEFLASLKIVAKKAITGTQLTEGPASGVTTAAFELGERIYHRVVTQQYGKGIVQYGNICDAQGKIYIEAFLTKPVNGTIDGFIGADAAQVTADEVSNLFSVAWAQYDSLELETEIGEVSFKLDSVFVAVTERKLRATWSPEMAQDVNAFHSLDAEAELTAILSEQIAAEIDREILKDLRQSPWKLDFDYNGWRRMQGYSTNYTQKDWNQMLITKINQISAQIHKATLRGGANFIVCSAEVSAVFNDLEYFHVTDANAEANTYSMGIEKIGSLQGRYVVYVDPYSPAYSVIIGHKGDSLLDTGYIYAPYVPMQLTPVVYNPFNMAPIRMIMTRYAKKMVNNRFYGNVHVYGLQTWSTKELR